MHLLRSGEVLTFPALLKRVVDDIQEASSSSSSSANTNGSKTNGVNGAAAKTHKGSLAVPQGVVDETLRVTRECLENVCEITDQGAQ